MNNSIGHTSYNVSNSPDQNYLPNFQDLTPTVFTYIFQSGNNFECQKLAKQKEMLNSVKIWKNRFERRDRSIKLAWMISTIPFIGIILLLLILFLILNSACLIFKKHKRIKKAQKVKIIEDFIILMTETSDNTSAINYEENFAKAIKKSKNFEKLKTEKNKIHSDINEYEKVTNSSNSEKSKPFIKVKSILPLNLNNFFTLFKRNKKTNAEISTDILSFYNFRSVNECPEIKELPERIDYNPTRYSQKFYKETSFELNDTKNLNQIAISTNPIERVSVKTTIDSFLCNKN